MALLSLTDYMKGYKLKDDAMNESDLKKFVTILSS